MTSLLLMSKKFSEFLFSVLKSVDFFSFLSMSCFHCFGFSSWRLIFIFWRVVHCWQISESFFNWRDLSWDFRFNGRVFFFLQRLYFLFNDWSYIITLKRFRVNLGLNGNFVLGWFLRLTWGFTCLSLYSPCSWTLNLTMYLFAALWFYF